MFQRAITLDQYAGLFPALTVLGRVDAGLIASTTATHPRLGAVVVLEDMAADLLILSERAVSDTDLLTQGSPLSCLCDGGGYCPSCDGERLSASL